MGILDRIKHGWNAFRWYEENYTQAESYTGPGSSRPQHKNPTRTYNQSDLSKMIFNRIATDTMMVDIQHVKVNPDGQTREIVKDSGLQNILSCEANIDQSNRQFMHDLVYSLLDEGVIAVVPVDTTLDPNETGGYSINSMRVGRITAWFPDKVRIDLYNEKSGRQEPVTMLKSTVAIIENPFYEIVNDTNSSLQRLIRKMALIDSKDELVASGKLNLLLQLPYTIKNETKQNQAAGRIKALEGQLADNKYGIGYIDGTEKVIQLNRSIDNDLLDQIKYLRDEFFNQLGLTPGVFSGTATEAEMRNYYNRSIDPILTAIIAEFRRKFLTKTARTQGYDLAFYRDPFKLVPIDQVAEIADKFTRNAILTSNEIRKIVGYGPSDQPIASVLSNKNIADANQEPIGSVTSPENIQNGDNTANGGVT